MNGNELERKKNETLYSLEYRVCTHKLSSLYYRLLNLCLHYNTEGLQTRELSLRARKFP